MTTCYNGIVAKSNMQEKPCDHVSISRQGRRICAYCATVMGPAETEGDTHGVCTRQCFHDFCKKTIDEQNAIREKLKKL